MLQLAKRDAKIRFGEPGSELELARKPTGDALRLSSSLETAGDVILDDGGSVRTLAATVAALKSQVEALQAMPPALPAGAIAAFAAPTVPTGWLECDGASVSRAAYPALFASIGVAWGVGDGSATFTLPDLRGAFLRGAGTHGTELAADGAPFAGPSIGAYQLDSLQGHAHESAATYLGVYPSGGGDSSNGGAAFTSVYVGGPINDGVHGEPRVGAESRPFAAGVRFCIKAS